MKKKFSKILGIGVTLALVTSLLLMAAPVSADVDNIEVDIDDTEISAETEYAITFDVTDELETAYSLYDGDLGSAEWTTGDVTDTDPDDPDLEQDPDSGSIFLDRDETIGTDGSVYVDFAPPSGITMATLSSFTAGFRFYGTLPNLELRFTAPDCRDTDNEFEPKRGHVDVNVSAAVSGTGWKTGSVDNVTQAWYYGNEPVEGEPLNAGSQSGSMQLDAILAHVNATAEMKANDPDSDATDWELTRVRFELWTDGAADTCYIDDLTIHTGDEYGFDEAAEAGTITIEFPEGTEVASFANGDVTVQSSKSLWEDEPGNVNPIDVGLSVVTTEDPDDVYTVTIDVRPLPNNIAENTTVMVNFLNGTITNPDDAGDYTLWVSTSEEDEPVESESYEIEVPEIEGLPGVVSAYNPSGILMASYTGDDAVKKAIKKADDEDWVIKLGPGTYGADDTFAADVDGVTFEAVGDVTWEGVASITAADVVIEGITFDGDGESEAVSVSSLGTGVSFEDCAFEDADTLLQINADDITIDDCTFTIDGIGIDVIYTVVDEGDEETTPPAITDCTFTVEEDGDGVGIEINADIEVTGCTFTVEEDGEGVGIEVNDGDSVIEDCTFDGLETVLDIDADTGTLDFFGNTIQDCIDVAINVDGTGEVLIHNNTITGSDDEVILDVDEDADAGVVVMLFNDITDNAGDEDLLVNNNDTDVNLYVINNWWGDADGPSQGEDAFSADVVYEPFLNGPAADSVIDAGTDDFDAEDECGVTVTAEDDAGVAVEMDIVGAAIYPENPAAAIDDAVGFWDVCMIDAISDDVASVTIRFYTDVTEDTEVYVWGEARGEWLQCDPEIAVPNLFSGFIAVTVGAATTPTLDDLGALPFAVVEPPAEAELDEDPELLTPTVGADDVSLTPTFAWSAVADADGYYFEFADNANFVTPLVKLDGDLGRLIVTAYAYVKELPYSTAYYWRVKAVSGTEAAGDLKESDWVSGLFITMAEPVEPTPPVVIEPYEPPEIIIEQPDIIVPLPAETPITPAWIYVIISVGAVLVIGLIVLIVRTRRVA